MILKKLAVMGAFALAFSTSGGLHAANLVSNGDFESFTTTGNPGGIPGAIDANTTLADWALALPNQEVNFLFAAGTADTTGSYAGVSAPNGPYTQLWGSNNGGLDVLPASSPAGGNFIAADGDSQYSSAISQTINGLVAGQSYQLGFYWAAAQWAEPYFVGASHESWQVSLGGETQSTAVVDNASQGFVPWMYQTMTFTATSSSEVLSFLAVGGPMNLPPMSLLDGVTLEMIPAAVPEPSSLILLGSATLGLLGVGLHRRVKSSAV